MIAVITCPLCNVDSKMSLLEDNFSGVLLCWKCKAKLSLEIKDRQVTKVETISDEEFTEQLELDKLKKKFQKSENE
ncbi:MAG: hypothetical protein FWF37_01250 [Chloroflexi bacterium]|nr:hypothetical protein [Chloroflexota bacterium]